MTAQNGPAMGLYIATKAYPDRRQYEESQEVLKLLRDHGLVEKISVRSLRTQEVFNATRQRQAFDHYVNEPSGVSLPYLVCAEGGEMAGVYGFSGIEAITEHLDGHGALKKEEGI